MRLRKEVSVIANDCSNQVPPRAINKRRSAKAVFYFSMEGLEMSERFVLSANALNTKQKIRMIFCSERSEVTQGSERDCERL